MIMKNLVLIAAGALAAASFILACSDDSPGDADAAVCDCPTVQTVRQTVPAQPIVAGGLANAQASCPAGSILLGGGCDINSSDFRLILAGFREPEGNNTPFYACEWKNDAVGTITVDMKVWAACQVP